MTVKLTAGATIETNHDTNSGVIGCFAEAQGSDRADGLKQGDIVLLTAGHVLFPGFRRLPDVGVYSPNYSSCCSSGDRVATVASSAAAAAQEFQGSFAPTGFSIHGAKLLRDASKVNCAVAKIDPSVEIHNVWPGPESIAIAGDVGTNALGIGAGPPIGTLPSPGQYARLYAPGRGVVFGTMLKFKSDTVLDDEEHILYPRDIMDLAAQSDKSLGILPLVDQFMFLPRPTPKPGDTLESAYSRSVPSLSDDDAGAILINSSGLAIGMLTRVMDMGSKALEELDRSPVELASPSNIGVCCAMRFVLSHLEIQIPADPAGFATTAKASGTMIQVPAPAEEVKQRRVVDALRRGLRGSRRGTILLGKIGQHRREVRQLFATARAIQATWRELRGAAFYHHCVENARDPAHLIPHTIDGIGREQLVMAMLPLLQRHASPALARDIARYQDWAIAMLLPITSLEEVPAIAAQQWPVS
jgi:hypothetical protein